MKETLLIRLKRVIKVREGDAITLGQIAQILTEYPLAEEIKSLVLYKVGNEMKDMIVIDQFTVSAAIKVYHPELQLQFFGLNGTLIKKEGKRKRAILLAVFMWLILFLGTAMTMMNFHFDVSMQEVHIRLHYLLTGQKVQQPLFIQIPYAIGLMIGMLLFLNVSFLTKKEKEPTPLALEMYLHEKNVAEFIMDEQKKEARDR